MNDLRTLLRRFNRYFLRIIILGGFSLKTIVRSVYSVNDREPYLVQ